MIRARGSRGEIRLAGMGLLLSMLISIGIMVILFKYTAEAYRSAGSSAERELENAQQAIQKTKDLVDAMNARATAPAEPNSATSLPGGRGAVGSEHRPGSLPATEAAGSAKTQRSGTGPVPPG